MLALFQKALNAARVTHLCTSSTCGCGLAEPATVETVAAICISETTDCVVQRDTLGHPLSVLMGHQGPVTYVDFNKVIPNALLSSSYDGTCRIWDATTSGQAAHVMQASALFGSMKGFARFGGTAGLVITGQANRPMTRQEVAEAAAAEASTTQNQVSSVSLSLTLAQLPSSVRLMSVACCLLRLSCRRFILSMFANVLHSALKLMVT